MSDEIEITTGAALRKQSRHKVTCPETGNVYLMRRPNLTDAITSGVLPENFVSQTMLELSKQNDNESENETKPFTDATILHSEKMMMWLITASMLSPKIVAQAVTDEEIEFYDIPPTDRQHLYLWAKGEIPEVPLATQTGEVTVGAVESFPDEEGSGESVGVQLGSEGSGQELAGVSGATA